MEAFYEEWVQHFGDISTASSSSYNLHVHLIIHLSVVEGTLVSNKVEHVLPTVDWLVFSMCHRLCDPLLMGLTTLVYTICPLRRVQ